MLVIGNRGAAGIAPENTLAAMQAGIDAGADILHFDVRLTRDNVLVLVHDFHTLRTQHKASLIGRKTYDELQSLGKDKPKITRVEKVLDRYFGTILLNIDLKSRGSGEQLIQLLTAKYIKSAADWDNVLISSFKVIELVHIRHLAAHANLALVQRDNPFLFVAYHRFIKFTAVGFHRLHSNRLALEIARKAKLFTYVYTIDRPAALTHLAGLGVEGVVTNYPDKFVATLAREDSVN